MKMKRDRCWYGRCHKASLWLFFFLILTVSELFAAETIHHQLHVKLHPAENSISVSDNIQLPAGSDSAVFSLRSSLTVNAGDLELTLLGESDAGRLRHYRINRLPADAKVQLNYEGKIVTGKTTGPFDMPESVLDTENIYLDNASAWVPRFNNHPLHTFSLRVEGPQNWQIISQGKRSEVSGGVIFNTPQPQDTFYLLGGRYQRYSKNHGGIDIEVYLYEADTALAEKYLQTSADYIDLYSNWIGRYPYARFAVVENRWQTGYGMPSFTLLGSTVIRLPFILSTSLPHEILHNWWGNGVYIDASKGNWSEGLTAYMSDHFSSEQQGKGRDYRRKALERYANFAAEQRDFALTDFSSRHDEASQAVGYSKSLMLFHMLRMLAGDDAFNHGLRQFWQRYQYNYASFTDLIQQLYADKGEHKNNGYRHFIKQWLKRTGAPEISLDKVSVNNSVENQDADYLLSIEISQQQSGPVYQLQVPLEVTLQGEARTHRETVSLTEKNHVFTFKYKQQPQAVTLDPDFDVFRLLHANERPASLGRLFGAKKQLLVLPANGTAQQIKAWQDLASKWSGRYNNVEVVFDNEIKALPDGVPVWLLGWNNALLKDQQYNFTSTSPMFSQMLSRDTVTINKQKLHADNHAVVLLDADNSRTAMGFIGAEDAEVIAAIARKLPHYSSYGVLVFQLPEVKNIFKQHLPVLKSPMVWKLDQ